MVQKSPFLTADWRHLIVCNYEVTPQFLAPWVPRGTELDCFGGTTYLSLVAFSFLNTRVAGWRIPWHVNFEEINLRFYVRRTEGNTIKRGVVFIKELVPRLAIALVAKVVYNENYAAVPTWSRIEPSPEALSVEYGWGKEQSTLRAEVAGSPTPLIAGSESEFILEHYWGYCPTRDGQTTEYEVAHPRWRAWTAPKVTINVDFARQYGPGIATALKNPPRSCFVAEGSAVAVYPGRVLPAAT